MFAAGFLVIRVSFVLTNGVRTTNTTANISEAISNNGDFAPIDPMKADSDHDGLPDRDEIIYGTDPFQPDSDGDGYKDGEEVAAGTDPLDPNDNIKARKNGTSKGSLSLVSPTANLTDRLMNMGLASLVDDSGNLNPSAMTDQRFADILTSVSNEAIMHLGASPISDQDIKVIDDNSQTTIKKYVNTVSVIIEEGIFSPSGAMITGSADDIIGLSTSKNYYANKYNALKAIEVPSSWKELHKSVLSNLQILANSTQALTGSAIDSDPIKAGFALTQLQNALLSLNDLLSEASHLAKSQNIDLNDSIFEMLQISKSAAASSTPMPTP